MSQDCCLRRGRYPIYRFLWTTKHRLQRELENLKLVEATLDGLIKSCAQQLFHMTDDAENSAYPLTARLPSIKKKIQIHSFKLKLVFFNLSLRRPT